MRSQSWILARAASTLVIGLGLTGMHIASGSLARSAVTPPRPGSRVLDLPVVPLRDTAGVDMGETVPDAARLDAVRTMGFHWARAALSWASIEKQRGVYDFSAAEALDSALRQHGLAPILVLPADNPIYGTGYDDIARRTAFASFAGEAARRFHKGTWEIVGPRSRDGFTDLSADPAPFVAWVAAAARAIHGADPRAIVLAGTPRGFDLTFVGAILRGGIGDGVNGLAVHPFRSSPPETWADDLQRLQTTIVTYAPRRSLSVWVTAWGYPIAPDGLNADEQAGYFVREMLLDYGLNVPATLWYRLDAGSPGEPERGYALLPGETTASPIDRAAEFMDRNLSGMKLLRVRELPAPYHGLVFTGRHREINVFWCDTGESTLKVTPRGGPKEGMPAFDLYGASLPPVRGPEFSLKLTGAPVYVEGRIEIAGLGA